jgi:hypothetical protein
MLQDAHGSSWYEPPNEDVRIQGSFRRDNGHATDIVRRPKPSRDMDGSKLSQRKSIVRPSEE